MKVFIIVISAVMVIILTLCSCIENIGELRIREIPDVEDWVPYTDMSSVVKCYIIDNPPADYSELRDIAEKHINDNWDNIVSSDDKAQTAYKCFFYRASKKLPWNWKENNAHMFEDHIEHHTDDMIISVRWTSEDSLRKYSILKKSDADDNYGLLLEEIHYKGNQLIKVKD